MNSTIWAIKSIHEEGGKQSQLVSYLRG